MAAHPVDTLAHLPSPPLGASSNTAALFNGELLAYGSASSVVIVDVNRLTHVASLTGNHRGSNVTAIAWHPNNSSRDPQASASLRLASGDDRGRVVVWNVGEVSTIAALEDPLAAATSSSDRDNKHSNSNSNNNNNSSNNNNNNNKSRPSVNGLAWVTDSPSVLAVLLSPGFLLIWDCREGNILWKNDMTAASPPGEIFSALGVDPSDRTNICLAGSKGTFAGLALQESLLTGNNRNSSSGGSGSGGGGNNNSTSNDSSKVFQRRYQADLVAGGRLKCCFSGVRDIMLLLLDREIIAFDIEFGRPIASTPLAASRSPFTNILLSCGHSAALVHNNNNSGNTTTRDDDSSGIGGVDVLICSHADNSISVWQRKDGTLSYTLVKMTTLIPPPPKFLSSPAPPQLVTLTAGLWKGLPNANANNNNDYKRRRKSVLVMGAASDGKIWQWQVPLLQGTAKNTNRTSTSSTNIRTSITAGDTINISNKEEEEVALLGIASTLPGHITAFAVVPCLIALDENANNNSKVGTPVAAVGTSTGAITLATFRRGTLTPLSAEISAILAVHGNTPVRGIRWLGQGPRVISYSSEFIGTSSSGGGNTGGTGGGGSGTSGTGSTGGSGGGYVNRVIITDLSTRTSIPLRYSTNDVGPIAAIRTPSCGSYALVVLRKAPSEIWDTRDVAVPPEEGEDGGTSSSKIVEGGSPTRIRLIDLPFTAVDWISSNSRNNAHASSSVISWGKMDESSSSNDNNSTIKPSSPTSTTSTNIDGISSPRGGGGAVFDGMVERRLAFALVDGRVGVLSVKGRRIVDTKPHRPSWLPLATGEFRATAVAAWAQYLFLGDADGFLVAWDTTTGHTVAVDTGGGRILKIQTAPPPSHILHGGANTIFARLAVLYGGGGGGGHSYNQAHGLSSFAVWEFTVGGGLVASHVDAVSTAGRVGRVTEIGWVPIPGLGGGCVVAASLVDGSMVLVDTAQGSEMGRGSKKQRLLKWHTLLDSSGGCGCGGNNNASSEEAVLKEAVAAECAGLLPQSWMLLLRILLQQGVPVHLLEKLEKTMVMMEKKRKTEEEEEDVQMLELQLEAELWALMPPKCKHAWSQLAESAAALSSQHNNQGGGNLLGDTDRRTSLQSENPTLEQLLKETSLYTADSYSPTKQQRPSSSSSAGTTNTAAAEVLGYRSNPQLLQQNRMRNEVKETIKELGGAFKGMAKEVALAGKKTLSSTVAAHSHYNSSSTTRYGGGGQHYSGNSGTTGTTSTNSTINESGFIAGGGSVSMWDAPDPPLQVTLSKFLQKDSLVGVLQACSKLRGHGKVLSPEELEYYTDPGHQGVAYRMALGAELAGRKEEAQFWRRLPATLHALQLNNNNSSSNNNRDADGPLEASSLSPTATAATTEAVLWSAESIIAEAKERSRWHDGINRREYEASQELQERRMLELISLGDYQGAVGLLLSSPPDNTARYYRDALCALGLAYAVGQSSQLNSATTTTTGIGTSEGDGSLFSQAAKIISVTSAFDSLLGVPLLSAIGHTSEAVNLLLNAKIHPKLYGCAASMIAGSLHDDDRGDGGDRLAAIKKWVGAEFRGRPWSAAGVLVGAGAMGAACGVLREAGFPDAEVALLTACKDAGIEVEDGGDGGDNGGGDDEYEGYLFDLLQQL